MSKKIRTEYMKKFRDPKWETFSKSYEDSVKYRLTRRLMEQTHRPLFENGWDSGSDSSGRSSPKLQEVNISNGRHYISSSEYKNETAEVLNSWKPQVNGEVHTDTSAAVESSAPLGRLMSCVIVLSLFQYVSFSFKQTCQIIHFAFITENGLKGVTTNGPSESIPKRRQRYRAPRSEPCYPNKELDSDESHVSISRKPSRAKSQPPGNTKERTSNRENRRSFIPPDWAERHMETRERRTPNIRASVSAGEVRPVTAAFCVTADIRVSEI